ncbi:MAG: EAL domain-containing protein [Candidatus Acidiferrum sp.]
MIAENDSTIERKLWHRRPSSPFTPEQIAVRLRIAFGVLVGLLIAVGYLGVHRMDQINSDLENILGKRWVTLQLAREALMYSAQNSRITMQIFLTSDHKEIAPLLAKRAENSKKISATLEEIKRWCESQEEKRLLSAVEDSRGPYVENYLRALHLLLDEHKRDEAADTMTKQTTPALLQYHAAWDEFMHFEMDQVDIAAKQSRVHYASTRRLALWMITAAVLIASAIALFAIRKIVLEMQTRMSAERKIKDLNADLEQRVRLRTHELEMKNQQLATEVEERKSAEEQIQFLAYYDPLTGLPNRTLLRDRMTIALASARRRGEKVALLFLDLDNFKNINDSLGHTAGDFLLKEVANRLKRWTREQDTVARLGGDEFILVLTAVREMSDARVTAERIVHDIAMGFVIQGKRLTITCSLGISLFPDHGTEVDALIKNADVAMYSAKEIGRNNLQFFTQEMSAQVLEKSTLENSLRGALENNELFLVYQPQVDFSSGNIIGAEALLRWRHPELGLITPDRFIPIAENTGLIIPIGEWVMRTACVQACQWQKDGLPALTVAVNVSPMQFRQKVFPQMVKRVLRETGLLPQCLDLELTEGLIISSPEVVLSTFQELKEMGVKLSIDDFGTGYSNLSYLRHFPVHKLKIDRSFVRDLASDPDDASITSTIISMAKSLDLKVIAEGVENEEQISFLRAHHCDEFQGFYFSKPLPANDFAERLRRSLLTPACSSGQLPIM